MFSPIQKLCKISSCKILKLKKNKLLISFVCKILESYKLS